MQIVDNAVGNTNNNNNDTTAATVINNNNKQECELLEVITPIQSTTTLQNKLNFVQHNAMISNSMDSTSNELFVNNTNNIQQEEQIAEPNHQRMHTKNSKQQQQHSKATRQSGYQETINLFINNNNNTNTNTNGKLLKTSPYKHLVHATQRNYFFIFLKNFVKFLINLIILNFLFIYLFVALPIVLLKYLIFKLFQLLTFNRSPLATAATATATTSTSTLKFLTPMELFWLYDTKLNKSIGSCLFFIEGNLTRNTIRDLLKNRLIVAASRDGKRLYPRFTQIIAHIWGFGYAWLNAHKFDIDEHLIEINNDIKLNTEEDLQELVVKLTTSKDLDYQKPLWSIYYKTNYGADRQMLIIFVYHMCLSDGVSLMRVFLKGIVDNRLAVDVKPRFGYRNFNTNLLRQCFTAWQQILHELLFRKPDGNLFKQNLSGQKEVCWSEPFNFLNANRLKLVTRSSMNDVLMSVVAGSVRTYLKKCGVNNPYDMHCVISIDLRSNSFPLKLGYDSTVASVRLPTNIEGCIPRLWDTRDVTSTLKRSSDYLSCYIFINLIFYTLPNFLAAPLARSLFKSNTLMLSTLAAGNTTLSTVSLGNRNVKNVIYLQPCVSNIALNCSIITYGDEVRLAIMSDKQVVTNPKFIANEFLRQLDTLKELLSNRRIPGEVRKAIREPMIIRASVSNIIDTTEDLTIDDIQTKMSEIQHELQNLTYQYENLDRNSSEFLLEKKRMALKLDTLRHEFRNLLIKIQAKQCQETQTIPSDDEDELDPDVRVRLRSASIASRTSVNSSNRRHKSIHESGILDDRALRSRETSFNLNVKQGSVSYAAGISSLSDRINVNRAHSLVMSEKSNSSLHVV